jgi:hypothetical protein
MGCGCNGDKVVEKEPEFIVTYPNGEKKPVTGEHAAKVAQTLGPAGTTYSRA